MPRSFARKQLVLSPDFFQYLDTLTGTIQYRAQDPAGSTYQRAWNLNVGALADSSTFANPGDNPLDMPLTGVTMGVPFGGNIPLAGSYINNDFGNFYSTELASVFSSSEGGIGCFVDIDTSVLTDGTIDTIISLFVDSNNLVFIRKSLSVLGKIEWNYKAGGSSKTNSFVLTTGTRFLALTWSVSNDEVIMYIDGVKVSTLTTLGTWSGGLTDANIGSNTGAPSLTFNGIGSTFMIFTYLPSPAEIADIYNRSGI